MSALHRCAGTPCIALLLLAPVLACAPAPPRSAVLRVDGSWVPYAQFEEFVSNRVGLTTAELESAALEPLFGLFLRELLLEKAAGDAALVDDPAPSRVALEERWLEEAAGRVTEAQLRTRYRSAPRQVPETVRLAQIRTETRQLGERIRERALASGFVETLEEVSQWPGIVYAGIQDRLLRRDLPAPLADTIFALEPGAVSELYEAELGFLLFSILDRRPARQVPFDEARPDLEVEAAQERVAARLDALERRARERYNLEILEGNLPFDFDVSAIDHAQP